MKLIQLHMYQGSPLFPIFRALLRSLHHHSSVGELQQRNDGELHSPSKYHLTMFCKCFTMFASVLQCLQVFYNVYKCFTMFASVSQCFAGVSQYFVHVSQCFMSVSCCFMSVSQCLTIFWELLDNWQSQHLHPHHRQSPHR